MSDPPRFEEIRPASSSSTPGPERSRSRAGTLTADGETPWRNRPSIRIRRLPSQQSISSRPRGGSGEGERPNSGTGSRDFAPSSSALAVPGNVLTRPRAGSTGRRPLRHETRNLEAEVEGNRRRSSSDPTRNWNAANEGTGPPRRQESYMPNVAEETGRPSIDMLARPSLGPTLAVPQSDTEGTSTPGLGRRLSNAMRFPSFRPSSMSEDQPPSKEEQYEEDLVDVLDTIDPQVSTLNTLNNVQNSLFVPDLGRYLNRRPTYTLSRYPTKITETSVPIEGETTGDEEKQEEDEGADEPPIERMPTLTSLTSRLDEDHFAVLPHGERLKGWSKEDRDELNDHVRHLLHSRKEKFKRSMKGFGQYVRKPLGFFVTLYATLITLFGLAWVLFLIGWISVGSRKDYLVNVIDNVLVALFAIMGDGLAPFRAVDTYHMCFIAHYHHLTWRLRREQSLPKLKNHNDLPALTVNNQQDVDIEGAEEKMGEFSVLSPLQQKRLVHHQKKFSRSHTFYKPHETETHYAFPLRLLVAVVVLLDCHSLLQIALGTCTWAISYHTRPFALTTVILCCSITCNISAGVVITVGDRRTRKRDVLERMFRQQLTAEAMVKVRRRKELEGERERERVEGGSGSGSLQATPVTTVQG